MEKVGAMMIVEGIRIKERKKWVQMEIARKGIGIGIGICICETPQDTQHAAFWMMRCEWRN